MTPTLVTSCTALPPKGGRVRLGAARRRTDMKRLLLAIVAVAPLLAVAQESPAATAERARIAAERAHAEATYQAQAKVCWGKFAVNDCLATAKARRREVLADLRRQEVALNDEERRQRAAQHQRDIEERTAPVPRAAQPGHAGPEQTQREQDAAERAAARASKEAEHGARPDPAVQARERAARTRQMQAGKQAELAQRESEAAENVQRREAQEQEAREHRESVERRQAQRGKPPAKPLPAPPAD
jgi:colicin import membrane protein